MPKPYRYLRLEAISPDNQSCEQNKNGGKNKNSLGFHSLTASKEPRWTAKFFDQTLLPLLRFLDSLWLYLFSGAKVALSNL